jgi:dipeptidyl aminopeptidase/acylaminoacyl peptidase
MIKKRVNGLMTILVRFFALILLFSVGIGIAQAQIPTPHTFGHLSSFGSQLNADGGFLLRVQRNAGRMAVIVSRADGSDPVFVVKPEENLPIYFAQWARDANRVIVSVGVRGSGLEMLYAYDMESGKRTDLLAALRAPEALYVSAGSRDNLAFPIAIYRDTERPVQQSLFQLDMLQGRLQPIVQDGDVIPFLAGACSDVPFGLRFERKADDAAVSYLVKRQGRWQVVRRIGEASRAAGTALASCSAERGEIYFLDADTRDFLSLASYDLDSLQLKSVSADDGDISSILFDRRSGAPVFYTATYEKPKMKATSEAGERVQAAAGPHFANGFELLSSSADGSAYLLSGATKGQADAVYLLRDSKLAPLYFGRNDLAVGHVLPQMPQAIKARDGVALIAYLTMPAEMCPGAGCKTVLLVHSGPGERDGVAADPVVQWLAAHGYMVLTVNFRGSHGAGRVLESLGRREWGGKMQDDLDDVAHWAIEHGLADPKKIAIMGGSYGGYAALEAVLRENHPYACAFSMSGMTDLAEFVKQRARAMPEMEGDLTTQIGDPGNKADRAMLKARSPIEATARLNVPLLLTGVENDPVVPLDGVLDFAQKLDAGGKAGLFSLFVYKGTGHVFNNAVNERLNWLLAERFFATCLDGRPGGLDEDLRVAQFAKHLDGLHLLP